MDPFVLVALFGALSLGIFLGVWIARARQSALSATLAAERDAHHDRVRHLELEVSESHSVILSLRQERSELERRTAAMQARIEEREAHFEQLKEQHKEATEEQKKLLLSQFENLANEVLSAKGNLLSEKQKELIERQEDDLGKLLNPLREQLKEFREKVELNQKDNLEGRAALKEQLAMLQTLNQGITAEAQNLTKALKGDKKLQGNWGELQVETILEKSGLIKGQEFEREANFKDEEGNNKRPDFVIHIPGGKHLIVDSKVSLVDYVAFVEAESDEEADAALQRHVKALRNHILSLDGKDYSALQLLQSPDFILMFVPLEPAFLAAFQADPDLYSYAFQRNIVVVSPSTLLASLRTVANLWSMDKQHKSALQLAERAELLHSKIVTFLEKMEAIDRSITQSRKNYDDAVRTLQGKGGVVSQAEKFRELGVRVKKEIPKALESDEA